MGFLREIIGFVLVFVAWFDPLGLDLMIRVLIFILGFDLMSLVPKVGVFVLDYFIGFGYLGFTLLILLVIEVITTFLLIGIIIKLILKPLAVFGISFLYFGLQPALILAGIDLLLNLGIGK